MRSSDEDMERLLLKYFVNDEQAARGFQSLSSVFEQVGRPVGWRNSFFDQLVAPEEKGALSAILERMVGDDLLESRESEKDKEVYYRASGNALRTERYEKIFPSYDQREESSLRSLAIDSTKWTGQQFILVDASVIAKVKDGAEALHNAVYNLHLPSNSENDDLKKLADALLAICSMAEPDGSIIDRITASPKFQAYVGLIALVATIRGALGI